MEKNSKFRTKLHQSDQQSTFFQKGRNMKIINSLKKTVRCKRMISIERIIILLFFEENVVEANKKFVQYL